MNMSASRVKTAIAVAGCVLLFASCNRNEGREGMRGHVVTEAPPAAQVATPGADRTGQTNQPNEPSTAPGQNAQGQEMPASPSVQFKNQ